LIFDAFSGSLGGIKIHQEGSFKATIGMFLTGKQGVRMIQPVKHDDWLFAQLQDAEFAAEYLNAANEDDDPQTYLAALRKVVEARCGMTALAAQTQLSRETLYRTLSARGNPTIKTLAAVLKATGLKISIAPAS
jgi:probable addiction module antidote protein